MIWPVTEQQQRQAMSKMWVIFPVGPHDPIHLRAIWGKGVPDAQPVKNITFSARAYPDVIDRQRAFEDTSCAAGPDAGAIFRPNPPGGKHQKEALAAIRHALSASTTFGQAGADPQTACLRIDDAFTQASAAMVGVEKKRRTARAREAVQGLISGGHLRRGLDASQDEWVWL